MELTVRDAIDAVAGGAATRQNGVFRAVDVTIGGDVVLPDDFVTTVTVHPILVNIIGTDFCIDF